VRTEQPGVRYMTDRKALLDQDETPEDVASLYSWANLHGAKYRDFSASRAQTREKARLRVQQALQEERERARLKAEAEHAEQLRLTAESVPGSEQARLDLVTHQEAARQAAQLATQQAAQQAAERQAQEVHAAEQLRAAQAAAEQAQSARLAAEQARAAQQMAEQAQAVQRAAEQARAAQMAAEQAQSARRVAEEAQQAHSALQQIRAAQQAAWQQQGSMQSPVAAPAQATPSSYFAPQSFSATASGFRAPAASPVESPVYAPAPAREERPAASQPGWGAGELQNAASRPAWLNMNRPVEAAAPAAAPMTAPLAPEDTLQGQRDRMTSRWFALKSVFQGGVAANEPAPAPSVARAPVVAVFSLAGGVGKTSVTATLGRALSARGERVLLVDTAPYGLLPFYFGARDQRPGQLRTFTAPGSGSDAPVQLITLDAEMMGPETTQQEPLSAEIGKHANGAGRVIVDLATASGATTRRVLRMAPLVLVPVMPDMNSVVSVSAIDAFFQRTAGSNGPHAMPFYVLNQFDASLPLHLDVREVLREQLGERLLPFALRRAPAVSEALAEGMTVMDYAPNSTVAEDFSNLAGWVKSQSAPASSGFRGVRWSER